MPAESDLPTVLFSIETLSREFDSKLVLATAFAASGIRAVVAHKEVAQETARHSEGVVWLGKSVRPQDNAGTTVADALLGHESALMFLHDEGGIHQANVWTQNVLRKHHVDFLRTRPIHRLCVWGERQGEVISSYAPELSRALVVTGSPRFDLCSSRYAWIDALAGDGARDECEPYILVATRFASVAHTNGIEDPFARNMMRKKWPESLTPTNIADLWFAKWQRDVRDFADMVMLIKELARAHPGHTVVVRPHPSESISFYRKAFETFDNVVVRRDQSVLYWIRSASLFVHNNSTSGIEAALAGRPVLQLRPGGPARGDIDEEVAREAGIPAGSIEEAVEVAADLLGGTDHPAPEWSPHARSMLRNLTTPSIPFLVEETSKVLDECGIRASHLVLPRMGPVRQVIRRFTGGPSPSAYVASKRGPLDASYVETLVDGCRRNGLGEARVGELTQGYVVLEPG